MDFPKLVDELNDAVTNGAAERRAFILERITDLFLNGSAEYTNAQIELFDDVFVHIATSIELSARTMLAERLANTPRAPSTITRILACDDAIAVAGPILERSQHLDANTLLTVVSTKSQQHLLAVSRRNALDETITNVLVERGDEAVIRSTVANTAAQFSDKSYATLVMRAESDDALATSVALRRDIPRHHLLRLVVRASHDVRQKLEAADPQMSAIISDAVAEAASTILDNVGLLSSGDASTQSQLEALHATGHLGDNDVLAFAAANQIEETTAALSVLCDLPIEAVDRAMAQDRPDAILVIAKAAEMSWPTARAILRMRAGARGISPGELEHCQHTFSRLSPATAHQVIEFRGKRSQDSHFSRFAGRGIR